MGAFATVGLGAAAGGDSTGVSAKEIKLGYIFSEAGLAGSTFKNAGTGSRRASIAQNAEGGVNGRKIVTEIIDDSGSVNNLQAAQDLVQNAKCSRS